MKRLLFVFAIVGAIRVSLAAEKDELKPITPARLVAIDVALAEFDASLWPAQDPAAGSKLLQTLQASEGQEKVYAFSQVRLSALEFHQARAQWGERVAVPAGRTLTSAGRTSSGGLVGVPSSATSYTRENLGILLTAMCMVDESGLIVIDLNLEQTRMAADTEVKLDPSDPDASALLKPVTKTIKTVVSVEDGQTIVLGGMTTRSAKQHRQDVILVTARIAGSKPVKAAARITERSSAPVAAVPLESSVAPSVPASASAGSVSLLREAAARLVDRFDRNGDGLLEQAERLAGGASLPPNADQDQDGKITVEELTKALLLRPREN